MKRNYRLIFGSAVLLITAASALSLLMGRYEIRGADVFKIFLARIMPVEKTWSELTENMVMLVRLPRILTGILTGAALSVAGASYQCIFRNPMAAPDILGASTGAGFGAALAILMGLSKAQVTLSAFLASLLCVSLVILSAKVCKGNQVLNLVLAGIMVSSLFQAGTSYLKLIADPDNALPEITYWFMGSLAGVTTGDLQYVWLPILVGMAPVFLLRWKMNLLTMDENEAKTMGVNTKRLRILMILASTLMTAAAVSVSGMIGWIGLVIPHMARKLAGNDCRHLIPLSAVLGGFFLLCVDDLGRNLYSTELPLGIITSVIGAPFFLYLMARKGEWN